jgi:hypothetical protein
MDQLESSDCSGICVSCHTCAQQDTQRQAAPFHSPQHSLWPLRCRLVERFLLNNYKPHQLSTYALTLYKYTYNLSDGRQVPVGEWAGVRYRCHVCHGMHHSSRRVAPPWTASATVRSTV